METTCTTLNAKERTRLGREATSLIRIPWNHICARWRFNSGYACCRSVL